jgi:hypothetical protein
MRAPNDLVAPCTGFGSYRLGILSLGCAYSNGPSARLTGGDTIVKLRQS